MMDALLRFAVLLAAVALSTALAHGSQSESLVPLVPLESLTQAEVFVLLDAWKLAPLQSGFEQHQLAGEALALLDTPQALSMLPAAEFPGTLPIHFQLLVNKVAKAKDGGGVGGALLVPPQKQQRERQQEVGNTLEFSDPPTAEEEVVRQRRVLSQTIEGDAPVNYTGVRVKSNTSAVFLGAAEDVGIVRTREPVLELRGRGLRFDRGAKLEMDIGEFLETDVAKYLLDLNRRLTAVENKTTAYSCRDLYNQGITVDGPQDITVTGRDGSINTVSLYCDMTSGGYTLVGQVEGWFDMYDSWMVDFVNVENLASTDLEYDAYACIDAVHMAVHHTSHIRISSPDGTQYVQWPMNDDQTVETYWDQSVGQPDIDEAADTATTITYVTDSDSGTATCYTNGNGIMPLEAHGGSYPGAFYNTAGNTVTSDYCMSIAVMLKTTEANDFYQNGNGGDAPTGDDDWPNGSYQIGASSEAQEALIWLY